MRLLAPIDHHDVVVTLGTTVRMTSDIENVLPALIPNPPDIPQVAASRHGVLVTLRQLPSYRDGRFGLLSECLTNAVTLPDVASQTFEVTRELSVHRDGSGAVGLVHLNQDPIPPIERLEVGVSGRIASFLCHVHSFHEWVGELP